MRKHPGARPTYREVDLSSLPRTAEEYRSWWKAQQPNIPYGYCWCDCGTRTNLAIGTDKRQLWFAHEPIRYVARHKGRTAGKGYIIKDMGYSSPCWIYQGYISPDGYGMRWLDGKHKNAHRAFYEEQHGPVPDELHCDHLCRIRACVNYDHVEPVAPAENSRRGKKAKLTAAQVKNIRLLYLTGQTSHRKLAAKYCVSRHTIGKITRGQHWANWQDASEGRIEH